ncbi:hypothetical protein BFW38_03305 [Terasakiispira papahanaumokuakeensis]|uniref:Uncharacterized protein n=1 Tax=Terasakiispira papahanaumokuakeensis TaxID=197479 RepID=A0A1E2V7T6_9GAMM|nr:hypothetical protein [Terasakiispira papahanaumokuakeensis]ODC02715.1 hypothetical protein BFW38_03305 [Terasakiispira papahanaumokuakeensis]
MAALQLNKRHFNESNNEIITHSGDAAFGHSGNDEFKVNGEQLSFWAGGQGDDVYYLEEFNGLVSIIENPHDSSNDKLAVSASLFDISGYNENSNYFADDLQVYSVDDQHLFIRSDSHDQSIVIANGMDNFGNVDFVRMVGEKHVAEMSSSLVFDNLISSDHYMGNVSASELGASDIANALDDVIHEAQLTSQIENNLASENLTWDESVDFIKDNIDNPQAIYVAANLSDLNTEMLGVLVGVSTDTVNEYFTANGFDPAGLG